MDCLDILESPADRRCDVVLLEYLIFRVQCGDHRHQPVLIRRVSLVDPGDVKVVLKGKRFDVLKKDFLHRGSHTRLQLDFRVLRAPIMTLKDLEEHVLVNSRRLLGGKVVAVPQCNIVEVG